MFRAGRPQIIAISLETAIQNGGIAFIVLSLTFPSPVAEIGLLPVISFFFCSTGPILFVLYAIYEIWKRCCSRRQSQKKEEEGKEAKGKGNEKEEEEEEEVEFVTPDAACLEKLESAAETDI